MVGIASAMSENLGSYIDALVRPRSRGGSWLGITFVCGRAVTVRYTRIFTSMTGSASPTRLPTGTAGGRRVACLRHGPARDVEP